MDVRRVFNLATLLQPIDENSSASMQAVADAPPVCPNSVAD
jgi:hypothetical protein